MSAYPDAILFNVSGALLGRVAYGVEQAFGKKPCQVFRPHQDDIASLMIAGRKETRRTNGVFVLVDSKENDVRNDPGWCFSHLNDYLCRDVLTPKLLVCMLGDEIDGRLFPPLKDVKFKVDKILPPKKNEAPDRFITDLVNRWNEFLNEPAREEARDAKLASWANDFFGL